MLLALTALTSPGPLAAACYDRDAAGRQTRFRLQGGEAFDTRTGLTWQRCSAGSGWSGRDGCEGETAYLGLDEAIRTAESAGGGWRVPSGPELESLIDADCGSPVVDAAVFPDIRPTEEGFAKYWTTNPVGALELYWNFDFVDGHPDGNTRGIRLAVRFVRSTK
jgi:hypothetical protein